MLLVGVLLIKLPQGWRRSPGLALAGPHILRDARENLSAAAPGLESAEAALFFIQALLHDTFISLISAHFLKILSETFWHSYTHKELFWFLKFLSFGAIMSHWTPRHFCNNTSWAAILSLYLFWHSFFNPVFPASFLLGFSLQGDFRTEKEEGERKLLRRARAEEERGERASS